MQAYVIHHDVYQYSGEMQTYTEHCGLVGMCNVTLDNIRCVSTLGHVDDVKRTQDIVVFIRKEGAYGGGRVYTIHRKGTLGARRGCVSLHTTS